MIDAEKIKYSANGKWKSILLNLGVSENILNGNNQPCPGCGGNDRFQFTNFNDDGMYNCRGCGPGDGIKLLMMVNGLDFQEALKQISEAIGVSRVDDNAKPDNTKKINYIKSKMQILTGSDPASLYLKRRKIFSNSFSAVDIGFIQNQKYYENGVSTGEYPVLVAAVRDSYGELITYQITYLTTDGNKAPVRAVKKLISPTNNESVGIYPYGFERMTKKEIGVCEGLEDSLSASKLFKVPVVGIPGTALLEKFIPNEKIEYLTAFLQNDQKFQGQAAGFKLLKTLADRTNMKLDFVISKLSDFNDDIISE